MAKSPWVVLDEVNSKLDTLLILTQRLLYGDEPVAIPNLPDPEPLKERYEGMAHFIKNRQHMAPVPANKGIVKQELRVSEDGTEILPWTEVAFDPASGEEQEPLPTYWAEVGKTVTREARYTRDDGTVSDVFKSDYEQVDNFTTPLPAPADLGEGEQIDETDADERPTS